MLSSDEDDADVAKSDAQDSKDLEPATKVARTSSSLEAADGRDGISVEGGEVVGKDAAPSRPTVGFSNDFFRALVNGAATEESTGESKECGEEASKDDDASGGDPVDYKDLLRCGFRGAPSPGKGGGRGRGRGRGGGRSSWKQSKPEPVTAWRWGSGDGEEKKLIAGPGRGGGGKVDISAGRGRGDNPVKRRGLGAVDKESAVS